MIRMAAPPTAKASVGATSAGIATLPTRPWASTAWDPLATNTEPTTPPISAWDELEGRPKYQVIRFQAIAPIRPPNTISGVTRSDCTTSLATVAATAREMNAPAKFRSAAYPTASRGGIALVEMVVATTLAVSWNPFVKSKASAVATTMTMTTSLCMAGGRQPKRFRAWAVGWARGGARPETSRGYGRRGRDRCAHAREPQARG